MFKYFLKDWWLKLLAFLGAIVLWVFSVMEREEVRNVKIPVVFKNIPPHLVLADTPVDSVEVELRGKVKHFLSFLSSKPKVIIDLSDASKGERTVELHERLSIPSVLQVRRIKPYFLSIKLEKLHRKRVVVYVPVEGIPKEGYSFPEIEYRKWVNIFGPKNLLKNFTQLITKPVNVEGKNKSFNIKIPINLPESLKDMVKVEPESIEVKVNIEPESVIVFRNMPVNLEKAGTNAYLLTKEAEVIIKGPKSKMKKVNKDSIKVVVRVKEMEKGHHKLPAEITVPPGVQVIVEPSLFDVIIR